MLCLRQSFNIPLVMFNSNSYLSALVVGKIESLQVDEVAKSSLLDEADQVAAQVRLLQVFHLEHRISIDRFLKDLDHLDKKVLLHELQVVLADVQLKVGFS